MVMILKLSLETQLHWGKYSGKTIEEVAFIDPEYIFWLNEKTEHEVSKDAVLLADENNQLTAPHS